MSDTDSTKGSSIFSEGIENNSPAGKAEDVQQRRLRDSQISSEIRHLSDQIAIELSKEISNDTNINIDDDCILQIKVQNNVSKKDENGTFINSEEIDDIRESVKELETSPSPLNSFWEYRQVVPYSIGITMLIYSLSTSDISQALIGSTILIGTALHYGN